MTFLTYWHSPHHAEVVRRWSRGQSRRLTTWFRSLPYKWLRINAIEGPNEYPKMHIFIVRSAHYHDAHNALVEISCLRYKGREAFFGDPMAHAIQIPRTGGPEGLNRAPIEIGAPGPGQPR